MFFDVSDPENIHQDIKQISDNAAMKKESKRLFVIVIVLVIMFFAALAAILLIRPVYEDVGKGVYGNTPGNLANMGMAAERDGWIYYYNINITDPDHSSIYKMRADGSEKTELTNSGGHYINAADGWIYFYM